MYAKYGKYNSIMSWTEEKTEKLKKLWAEGHTASQIARMLGDNISRNSVIGKAHRLNLEGRTQSRMISSPKINNNQYNTSKFKIVMKKNVDDKKKEEFNVWLDEKSKIILKVSYSKLGNWEYIVKNIEKFN